MQTLSISKILLLNPQFEVSESLKLCYGVRQNKSDMINENDKIRIFLSQYQRIMRLLF